MIRRSILTLASALALAAVLTVGFADFGSKAQASKTGCDCCGASCACTSCTCDASAALGVACDCCGGATCCPAR